MQSLTALRCSLHRRSGQKGNLMKKRVAVVGAGAAGLMAALDLREAGHDVRVFESRDRVGGRIHTVRFADGRFANAGAEWLNSSDAIALSLVERYQLDLVPNSGFEALVDGGELVLGESRYPVLDEAFDEAVNTITDVQEPWKDPALQELDRLSVAEWAYRTEADPGTIRRFFQDYEGEFMSPVTEISMAAAVLSSMLTNNDRAYRLREGTARLPEAMADDLGSLIQLSEAVTAVRQRHGHVVLRTSQGEQAFDAVVLALPLPVLARTEMDADFDVPWIAQGRGGKMLVPYANADFRDTHAIVPGATMKFVYANAPHQPGGGTILTAYCTQILEDGDVTATFSRWFPDLIRSPVEPRAVWWSLDPDSGTTYSAPQPGYLDALCRVREPQAKVVLAGEHTEMLFGYVESALVSGRRAASLVDAL